MTNFNLMILAAGYGTRMKELTKSIPKPLLKINNKELLFNNIEFFQDLGCKKILINTHYLYDQIESFIKKNYFNKNINIIFEPFLLNTGGGIKNALNYLENENFIVTNSDILWKEENKKDLKDFILRFEEIKTCKLLLIKRDNFSGLKKTKGDFILNNSLIKKCKKNNSCLYYTGLQIVNPSIFKFVDDRVFSMTKLWDKLIDYRRLQGEILNSNITHIGDINTFNQFKDY